MSLEKRTNVQTFLQTYQVSTLVVHDPFLLLWFCLLILSKYHLISLLAWWFASGFDIYKVKCN